MARLLFLDFDGVVNNMATYARSEELIRLNRLPVEHLCMEVLNRMLELPGAKVVISSSWRMFARGSVEMLQGLLDREGFKGEVIGATPNCFQLEVPKVVDGEPRLWSQRGDEIRKWLESQSEAHEFVVLDDDSDMDAVKDRFVHTDGREGLQERHLEEVLKLFATRE